MNNILVTAATGNIGSQIVKILKEKNVDFVAGVTANDKTVDAAKTVVVNFDDAESLIKAFIGIDTLFLLYPLSPKMMEWNKNAVDAAKAAGIKHIVRSSGAGADRNAAFLMPQVQGTIDNYVIESGIGYTITQPASFMQNFVNFMADDIKTGTVYQPIKSDVPVNWVDVRDIAAINAIVLMNPTRYSGKILPISGSENLSYAQALAIIGNAINKPVDFVTIQDDKAIEAMKSYGMPGFNIDMMMSLNAVINKGYAASVTNIVKEITGIEPIRFSRFVSDYKTSWM